MPRGEGDYNFWRAGMFVVLTEPLRIKMPESEKGKLSDRSKMLDVIVRPSCIKNKGCRCRTGEILLQLD